MGQPDAARPRTLLFGLWFDALTRQQVVQRCLDATKTREHLAIGVLNAAKLVRIRSDQQLRQSLLVCDLLLADGISVLWASRMLRRPLPERVTGIDLFADLLAAAARDGLGVYLLGAKPEVLQRLHGALSSRFPGLRVVGSHHGYFDESQGATIAQAIRDSRADMLFLGMVSPKKEIFLGTWGAGLGVPVQHGVGGSFDIFAGVTKRAPVLWQRLGMEWAYRLVQEPRRMWRRYLFTNLAFIRLLAQELVRPTPPP